MSRIGIERSTGLVYEGRGAPIFPTWPTPVVSQATLIESPADLRMLPGSLDGDPFTWMFREGSFDPVSRVRRGLIYQKFGSDGWESTWVEPHPAVQSDKQATFAGILRFQKELSVYIECTTLLIKQRQGEGMRLAIGTRDGYSLWTIIQTERTVNLDVLVTLRAESAFGILPALDKSRVSPEHLSQVEKALSRVLDAAYRELPTSVVDQCRNAMCVVVSRWMQTPLDVDKLEHHDLGALIKVVRHREPARSALHYALDIVNRLHPRGKDNEIQRLELRPVHEGDAEFAVHAVGFVLREIGWSLD